MARVVAPVAGAVIGFYVGGPQGAQVGWMIGSIVGSAVDPLEMRGPSIGDLAVQTSRDGAPRAILFGTGSLSGNVIYRSAPRFFDVETQEGKGGGPVQITEHVALSYGIAFIDAWANDVEALTRLWEDEKLVVDLTPESLIREESKEYLKKLTIYLGRSDQMPDPTYEADKGVGNTPFLRGTAWIMFNDIDITQRGSIASYRAEWSSSSVVTPSGGGWLFGPTSVNGAAGGSQNYYLRADTLEELPFATPTAIPAWMAIFTRITKAQNGVIFMLGSVDSQAAVSFDRGLTWQQCTGANFNDSRDVTWNGHFYYHGTMRSADGLVWTTTPNLPAGTSYVVAREFFNNPIVAVQYPSSGGSAQVSVSLDDGGTWTNHPPSKFNNWSISGVAPGHLQFKFTLDSTRGYYTDDLFATLKGEGSSEVDYDAYYSDDFSGTWMRKTFSTGLIWTDDGGVTWERTSSASISGGNASNSVAWGDYTWAFTRQVAATPHRHYINYNREGGKPDDPVLGPRWHEIAQPMYGNGGNICWLGNPVGNIATKGTTTVAEIVTKLLAYIGFDTAKLEFDSAGDEVVAGYIVGGLYSVVEAIRPLQQTHTFDFVAVDGKLKTVKRGGDPVFTLSDDDCIYDGEQEDDEEYMEDELEFPKKLHLDYQNPYVGYASSKATATRSSPDVRVKGEVSIMTPESFTAERAAEIADVMLKMAWVDVRGEVKRKVPRKYAKAIPSNIVILQSRGRVLRLRIEDIAREDGISEWVMRHDRKSAYSPGNHVVGAPLPEPTLPPSTIAGPTVFGILNAPARTEGEDELGYYVAGRGALPGWVGFQNQVSIDGGETFVAESTHTAVSEIGTLLERLDPWPSAYLDDRHSILVDMPAGSTFESVTDQQMRNYRNAIAIRRPGNTAEYLQFQTAVHEGGTLWRLSGFFRGRLGTDSLTAHQPGAQIIPIEDLQFVRTTPARIGMSTVHRPVSINDLAENTVKYDFSYSPAVNQTELAPTNLVLTKSGNVLSGRWVPRYRLGTEMAPLASVNQTGWRAVVVNAGVTTSIDIAGANFTMDVTGLSGVTTVTIYAVNRYTGLGLPLAGSITL